MNTDSWFFSLLILVGGVFTVAGMITYIFPPKKVNSLYGYRTNRSMKSYKRWKFAQSYSRKLMIKYGISMMVISCLGLFVSISEKVDFYLGLALPLLSTVLLFVKTEEALKDKFSNK